MNTTKGRHERSLDGNPPTYYLLYIHVYSDMSMFILYYFNPYRLHFTYFQVPVLSAMRALST